VTVETHELARIVLDYLDRTCPTPPGVVPWNLSDPEPTLDTLAARPFSCRPLSFWYAEWDDLDDFGADTW
jgi:hypothetical protein